MGARKCSSVMSASADISPYCPRISLAPGGRIRQWYNKRQSGTGLLTFDGCARDSPLHSHQMPGTLFVVATPIGNLEDITARALRVLREAALIAAEDTRRTGHLLARYGITTPTTSVHEHNETRKTPSIVARLARGDDVALVSDAG